MKDRIFGVALLVVVFVLVVSGVVAIDSSFSLFGSGAGILFMVGGRG